MQAGTVGLHAATEMQAHRIHYPRVGTAGREVELVEGCALLCDE